MFVSPVLVKLFLSCARLAIHADGYPDQGLSVHHLGALLCSNLVARCFYGMPNDNYSLLYTRTASHR